MDPSRFKIGRTDIVFTFDQKKRVVELFVGFSHMPESVCNRRYTIAPVVKGLESRICPCAYLVKFGLRVMTDRYPSEHSHAMTDS